MQQALVTILPMVFFFIIDLIILLHSHMQKTGASKSDRFFMRFVLCVTAVQGLAAVTYACDLHLIALNHGVQYVLIALSICCLGLAGMAWFAYLYFTSPVENKGEQKLFLRLATLPALILFAVCAVSPWTHWIMYIDENGVYRTGTLGFLQLLPYCYILFAIAIVFLNKKKDVTVRTVMRKFPLFVIPSMIGAVINILVVRGGYTQIGCSFGVLLMYLEQYMVEIQENRRLRSINEMNMRLRTANEEQKAAEDKNQQQLMSQLNLINTLSRDYLNVYIIKPETNIVRILKLNGYITDGITSDKNEYPYDAVCGKYIRDRVFADDVEKMTRIMDVRTIRHALEDAEQFVGTYRVLDNGEIHYYQYKYIKLIGTDSIIAGFQNVDAMIAEERERQDRLQKALEEARQANAAKTLFLNNMSHDIRTPMNAILGYAKLIESKRDDPELVTDYLNKIENSGQYLLAIINNVLDMARIESGKETVDESFVDLTDEACSVVPLLQNEISAKHLKFTQSMDIIHRYVFADLHKIREITMNLMSNAIKYTPEGGSIHMQFNELPCGREGYALYVNTITDTGIGMSEEFQKHIFDSFARERNTTESKVIGTGLGMSIVKRLVELMGGTIEVASEPGKGSSFTVKLEHRIVEDPETYLRQIDAGVSGTDDFSGRRVLIAEDNDLNAEIAAAILEELGISPERAQDGVACLDMLRRAEPGYYDMILMDIQMPNLNGYEATERIRREGNGIPIIAMTANAFTEDKQRALSVGMNGHLAKPIEILKLTEMLRKFLG